MKEVYVYDCTDITIDVVVYEYIDDVKTENYEGI